jgi:hypothetical protein
LLFENIRLLFACQAWAVSKAAKQHGMLPERLTDSVAGPNWMPRCLVEHIQHR